MRILRRSPWGVALSGFIVVLFSSLCGFALFFPAESLLPRLEAEGARHGFPLTIASLKTTFPLGLMARGMTIGGRGQEGGAVEVEEITLVPAWSRLFLGKAAVAYDAALLDGRVSGVVQRSGKMTLEGRGLSWRGPLPGMSGGILSLQGCSGEISASWPPQADDPQFLALECEEGKIDGLFGGREPLLLGRISLNASGKGKDLRVTTLAASGGHLDLAGNGSLLLNIPLGRSLLNLNLTLRPQPTLNPALAELLAAFIPPAVDGTSSLRLTGPFTALQQNRIGR